jgi:hypothetical protein
MTDSPPAGSGLERALEVVAQAERKFLSRISPADRRRLKELRRTVISP